MSIENILRLIQSEEERQVNTISLIASENWSSDGIGYAEGSRLRDKYAEGYPGKRYYNGCEVVDEIENAAIAAACELFGCNFANVQPHSGSQANEAIFAAFLKPGDAILGLALSHGGHLTHGFQASISGKLYNAHSYHVDEDGFIDMDEVHRIALEVKPKLIIAGASSYSRIINWSRFRQIADEVGAYYLADIAHYAGLIAGGVYPSPLPHADFVTSTTHKVIRGPRGGVILWNKEEFSKLINSAVFPGLQGGPMMHTIAAKAICFTEATWPQFKEYAANVISNAQLMCDVLSEAGHEILSGGTDCHMFVVNLEKCGITGAEAADLLYANGIAVSKSTVPNKGNNGIRIGTPSITSRGIKKPDVIKLAEIINDILINRKNCSAEVQEICSGLAR